MNHRVLFPVMICSCAVFVACARRANDDLFPALPPRVAPAHADDTSAAIPLRIPAASAVVSPLARTLLRQRMSSEGVNASLAFGLRQDTITVITRWREQGAAIKGDTVSLEFEAQVVAYLLPPAGAGAPRRVVHTSRGTTLRHRAVSRGSEWDAVKEQGQAYILLPFVALGVDSISITRTDRDRLKALARESMMGGPR